MKTKAIALTISLVFVSVALGFQDNPHMGTWKLNEAKSKFAGKARNHTVVYEAVGDQIKITVDGVDENGGAVHNEWTGKFDGQDYPVTGDGNVDARSYRKTGKNTLELTNKKDGTKFSIDDKGKIAGLPADFTVTAKPEQKKAVMFVVIAMFAATKMTTDSSASSAPAAVPAPKK
jgi:hypothetical protein